jgi:hypothetical protein
VTFIVASSPWLCSAMWRWERRGASALGWPASLLCDRRARPHEVFTTTHKVGGVTSPVKQEVKVKNFAQAGCWWLTSIIPATWEAEIRNGS